MNPDWSDQAILQEIGLRLRRERLNQNLTQEAVAKRVGIRRATLSNAESGEDFTVGTLLGILRALDRLRNLAAFLPDPGVSPMQLLKKEGKVRKRASTKAKKPKQAWTWGDAG